MILAVQYWLLINWLLIKKKSIIIHICLSTRDIYDKEAPSFISKIAKLRKRSCELLVALEIITSPKNIPQNLS